MQINNKKQLFCIPFAGGSSTSYLGWKKYLDNSIQIFPIERAGRGIKMDTPFYNSIEEEVEEAFNELMINLNGTPYALFGHSMGVIIIYELMNKIYQHKIQKPVHVFLSAGNPIHLRKNKNRHILPDDEFIIEMSKYGGMPEEMINDENIRNIFLPILREDTKNFETYKFQKYDIKWDIDISVFNGDNDKEVDISDRIEWREYTTGNCMFYTFKGNHFFINEHVEEVTDILNNILI